LDHTILLANLSSLGVRGANLEWFRNYLTDIKQFSCFSFPFFVFGRFYFNLIISDACLGSSLSLDKSKMAANPCDVSINMFSPIISVLFYTVPCLYVAGTPVVHLYIGHYTVPCLCGTT